MRTTIIIIISHVSQQEVEGSGAVTPNKAAKRRCSGDVSKRFSCKRRGPKPAIVHRKLNYLYPAEKTGVLSQTTKLSWT